MVLLEADNSELSQSGERLELALEIEVFKDESRDSVVEARDACPGTWVGGGVPSCKFVCFICTRFERQERFQIWVFRSLGEKEMEDEKKKVKGRRTYRLGFAIVVCILTYDWVCVCCSCVWLTRKISCWVCVWLTRKISCWVCVCVSGLVIFGF